MPASCSFVLENSGVAEPQNIRDKFNEAYIVGHPVTERVVLDTMVTIVDAGEQGPVAGLLVQIPADPLP